jgi:hypothetical protein
LLVLVYLFFFLLLFFRNFWSLQVYGQEGLM